MSKTGLKGSWDSLGVDGRELVKKKVREDPMSSCFQVPGVRVQG